MPDRRTHRGPDPHDQRAFAVDQRARLQQAVADLSWLLTRGYPSTASLKIDQDP